MRSAWVIVGAVVALLAVGTAAGAASQATIATASSGGVRVVLVAHRVGGAPPTARVTVATYTRRAGRWQRVASSRLHGTYFWNVVSAPHALCRLQLATAGPDASHPHVAVQVLVTPSIGCGQRQVVALPD